MITEKLSKKYTPWFVHVLLLAMVVAGHWYQIEECANVAKFMLIALGALGLMCLNIPAPGLFDKTSSPRRWLNSLQGLIVLLCVAAGWAWWCAAYLFAFVGLEWKRKMFVDSLIGGEIVE